MGSISVVLPSEGLRTRVTLFRAEIERFWLGFAKQSDQHIFFIFFKNKCVIYFSQQKLVLRGENFESNSKQLKISPLPRLWKRTNILKLENGNKNLKIPGALQCWLERFKC